MGYIHDLSEPFTPQHFCRAVPGPVRHFSARTDHWGSLVLEWNPPVGGGTVSFYRLERTREGRVYETLAELTERKHCLEDTPPHEPWFYRIVGVNARGAGRAERVWFFQRFGNGRSRLLPVPVRPGLRVGISVLEPIR
jgi:hypothetical protein